MPFKLKNNLIFGLGWRFLVMVIGGMIMFLSVAKMMAEKYSLIENERKIRSINYEYCIEGVTGQYKLPQVTILPNFWQYPLKLIKDELWLYFTSEADKPRISLLIADRRMMEAMKMYQQKKEKLAIETGIRAINKLEYADQLTSKSNKDNGEIRLLKKQLYIAGLVYKEAFGKNLSECKEADLFIKLINDWNNKQISKKSAWEN
ncbi:MAG TPA: hypothetical protein PK639_04445 [Candidatus Woesebacteria bacterium]|nr:hypothetical protein [Candidatus Woesebacteria bacterium]